MPVERARPGSQSDLPVRTAALTAAPTAAIGRSPNGSHAALLGVPADVPAAIRVIDRRTSSVTYANTAAVALAGNICLPVDTDE